MSCILEKFRRMERLKKNLSTNVTTLLFVSLMLIGSLTLLSSNVSYAQPEDDMTFTSGEKINFTSDTEMTFKDYTSMQFGSGVEMKFSSGIEMLIVEGALQPPNPDGWLEACDVIIVVEPQGYLPPECSWWEVIDMHTGALLGEFHVDGNNGFDEFHIDATWPAEGFPIPFEVFKAVKKIDIIEPCQYYEVHWPSDWYPEPCTWWELIDPETGELTGVEFHVDWTNASCEFHIDEVLIYGDPGVYVLPFPWYEVWAIQKIPIIEPCEYYEVHWPSDWYPEPCTWWELIDPETGEPTGYEFHVDWTNESCEFHIDEVIPEPYVFKFPVPYVIAEKKIEEIKPCDWFIIVDPPSFLPERCSWWEILDDTGAPTGWEFHVDANDGFDMFHVDTVIPDPLVIPPTHTVTVRKKIDIIQPCETFRVDDPALTPESCSWWEILNDTGAPTGIEFHVDQNIPADGLFHIDEVWPDSPIAIPPTYMLTAEKKIDTIQPCDWFLVVDPPGFTPEPCSWWEIVWPVAWAGITFHVDQSGAGIFHIDFVDDPPDLPPPPPWNVTARPYEPPEPEEPWYIKPPFPDYAPSGMPDFDQRQGGTYIWQDLWGAWSHCGPVACANSLWWFDSQYEYYYNPGSPPPPTYSDSFPLVQSYGGPPWDDHDPLNLPYLVEHLAWLMDCDALRTGPFTGVWWSGTYVNDMQAGLAHYLSWSGVNPLGDVNGDGVVDLADVARVAAALGSVPGGPGWDLAADVWPASTTYPPWTDNVIDANDAALVAAHMDETGIFYEHTADAWEDYEFFWYIENEVEKCQDVVLLLGFYLEGEDYREGGHYVTVAGVNSTTMELLISNPIRDDFEAGKTPGRSPVPHAHPPEPPYITHNDASLVSQDAYHVTLLPSPSGYHFVLDGYFDPPWEARIEYAVVTSPLAVHDVAVTNVTTSKDGCVPMPTVSQEFTAEVNVTVENPGGFIETFDVTAYAGINVIGTQTVTNLAPSGQITLTFTWNTAGFTVGNYTIKAIADTVPGETNFADNTFTDGVVKVTIVGDINGDDIVDMTDLGWIAYSYGATPSDPKWNPNADITEDGIIDMTDIGYAAMHYGETYP